MNLLAPWTPNLTPTFPDRILGASVAHQTKPQSTVDGNLKQVHSSPMGQGPTRALHILLHTIRNVVTRRVLLKLPFSNRVFCFNKHLYACQSLGSGSHFTIFVPASSTVLCYAFKSLLSEPFFSCNVLSLQTVARCPVVACW